MRRTLTMAVAGLALALATACGSLLEGGDVTPVADPAVIPARAADIRGTITKVMPEEGGRPLRVLVEAGDQRDVVSVVPTTAIYRDEAGELRNAMPAELVEGTTLRAWYDGAVKESYPRQADAAAIVIDAAR